ncbi:hypothetical protein JCM8097_004956 [Rhodosporidiobolus ruineniae]
MLFSTRTLVSTLYKAPPSSFRAALAPAILARLAVSAKSTSSSDTRNFGLTAQGRSISSLKEDIDQNPAVHTSSTFSKVGSAHSPLWMCKTTVGGGGLGDEIMTEGVGRTKQGAKNRAAARATGVLGLVNKT